MARLPANGLAPGDAAAEAYLDALTEVMSDGKLTGEEAKQLAHLAGSAGMGGEQVLALNRRFLDNLLAAARDDDMLTATEIRQLKAASKALSLPDYFGNLQASAVPAIEIARDDLMHPAAGAGNSMKERAERGVQALALQREGSSRGDIAAALRVSQETVKSLLRDAKFYENLESDPSRLVIAREALEARGSGMTRDAFQRDRGMTPGKCTEAWRDAAILRDAQSNC
jgi:DNA polymerase-3 subunit epsilon